MNEKVNDGVLKEKGIKHVAVVLSLIFYAVSALH